QFKKENILILRLLSGPKEIGSIGNPLDPNGTIHWVYPINQDPLDPLAIGLLDLLAIGPTLG
ncbi:17426_t:CDS:2, partial [Funneliformis geosporum]